MAGLLLATAGPVPAQTLTSILAKMDQAAPSFQAMSARLKRVTHTAVINDDSEDSGTIWIKRSRGRDPRVLIEFTQPDTKSVAFYDKKAEIYYPNIQTVQEWDLGKQGRLIDQFLLLGFGTAGKELARNYDIKFLTAEKWAGQPTTRLELIPKSAELRQHLKKVELWISEANGQPVQQKFYQPSGDYNLITYSEVKLDPNLSDDAVRLKLPKGVQRERPQK